MSLVPITEMLQQATADKYGVAAFNVENMEFVQGVMAAVSELKLPVILQTTPSTLGYAGIGMFRDMVLQAMDQFGVKTPVALHLDHGSSFELACRAVRGGYSSVMIDGSQLPLEENIALTRRVVDVAHACGVSVEAELGSIGGKEDDLVIDKAGMTDPETAVNLSRPAAVMLWRWRLVQLMVSTRVNRILILSGCVLSARWLICRLYCTELPVCRTILSSNASE
jgi:ketose-bisphosphate aldolase